jgi:hypothetical protein
MTTRWMTNILVVSMMIMEVTNSLQAWSLVQCEGGDRTTELWYHPNDQDSSFNDWGNPRIRASEDGHFLKWEGQTHTIKIADKYEISTFIFANGSNIGEWKHAGFMIAKVQSKKYKFDCSHADKYLFPQSKHWKCTRYYTCYHK